MKKDETQTWFLQKVNDTFMLYNENASRVRAMNNSREPISSSEAMNRVREDFKDRGFKVISMERVVMVTITPVRPRKKLSPKPKKSG
jgi:hypothetical protein